MTGERSNEDAELLEMIYDLVRGAAAPHLREAEGRVRALIAERDAYKRAKAENDDRFMLERDEARAALDAVRVERDALAAELTEAKDDAEDYRQHFLAANGRAIEQAKRAGIAEARAAALQTAIEALPERARAMDDQPDKYGVGWADAIRAIRRRTAAVGAVPETRDETEKQR